MPTSAQRGQRYWARISLTGSLGTASKQLGDLFKDGAWSFAAQLLRY
jgi:outer membrane protein, multidrug efflux system